MRRIWLKVFVVQQGRKKSSYARVQIFGVVDDSHWSLGPEAVSLIQDDLLDALRPEGGVRGQKN